MQRSLTTTSLRSHTAVASGYLHKLTHNGTPFARWHQRYYVLYSDGLLRSFKSSRARNSYRVIHVGRKCLRVRFGADTRSDECRHWPKNCPRALRFSVINIDREYHFYCESEREFAVWRDSLQQTLAKLGSAHSSYVERRSSSRPNPEEDDWNRSEGSYPALTPVAGSLRELRQAATEKRRARKDRVQKRARQKETGVGDAYDAVGPAVAVSYKDLDEVEENKKEYSKVEQDLREVVTNINHTQDTSEEDLLENVSDCEEICWSVSNYAHNQNEETTEERKDPGARKANNPNGIEKAFLEVQAIIDETFNDMC